MISITPESLKVRSASCEEIASMALVDEIETPEEYARRIHKVCAVHLEHISKGLTNN